MVKNINFTGEIRTKSESNKCNIETVSNKKINEGSVFRSRSYAKTTDEKYDKKQIQKLLNLTEEDVAHASFDGWFNTLKIGLNDSNKTTIKSEQKWLFLENSKQIQFKNGSKSTKSEWRAGNIIEHKFNTLADEIKTVFEHLMKITEKIRK